MKKRIIASLLTASMLAAALAGCGGSTAQTADTSADAAGEAESAQGDPATVTEKETNVSATADADLSGTTITFWHSMSGVNGEALTALVDRFNEENTYGITVDAEFEGEYDDAINKLKSSMVGGSGPDLIQVYEIGTRFMIDSGWVIPMQELMDANGYDNPISCRILPLTTRSTTSSTPCRLIHPRRFSITIRICLMRRESPRCRRAWRGSMRLPTIL